MHHVFKLTVYSAMNKCSACMKVTRHARDISNAITCKIYGYKKFVDFDTEEVGHA